VKLDATLKKIGFKQKVHEAAVYRQGSGHNVLLVSVYVDDLIIIDAEEQKVEVFKTRMKKVFDMSDLGLLCFYLGVKVRQDTTGIVLHQTHYAKRTLELGSMTGYNVGYMSRFMERPTMEHLYAVKRILRYVAGTLDYGLHYGRAPNTA
jgi:hypothetical protein